MSTAGLRLALQWPCFGFRALDPSLVLAQATPVLYATEENDEGQRVPVRKRL